jgi:hypothetical protein
MTMVENRGIPALPARPSYHAALLGRLKMDRSALSGHPFRERLEALLAEVERAYTGLANHVTMPAQGRVERQELKEQYAPLLWHYLGRAVRAVGDVEFALVEARVRCLLREFRAEMGRLVSRPQLLGSRCRQWTTASPTRPVLEGETGTHSYTKPCYREAQSDERA